MSSRRTGEPRLVTTSGAGPAGPAVAASESWGPFRIGSSGPVAPGRRVRPCSAHPSSFFSLPFFGFSAGVA